MLADKVLNWRRVEGREGTQARTPRRTLLGEVEGGGGGRAKIEPGGGRVGGDGDVVRASHGRMGRGGRRRTSL